MSEITQKWVKLLIPFTNNYKIRLTETELAKKSGIPQQSASRYLTKLVKKGLINYQIQGRNKLFYLDFSKKSSKIIINILESVKSIELIQNDKIKVIINEILDHCETLIVFGSFSSKKQTNDSDLDILLFEGLNTKEIDKIKNRNIIKINEHYSNYEAFSSNLKENNPLAIEIKNNHTIFGNTFKIINILIENNNE